MNNISIKLMSAEEFVPLYNKYSKKLFEDDHSYSFNDILSGSEKFNRDVLKMNTGSLLSIRLGAFDENDNFIGWSWGYQRDAFDFYMCNSGVLENYRRQGVYSQMLDKMISLLFGKGFQRIYSRHCATNNSVLIPKLKKGFVISSMEISDVFGVLVHLSFFFNNDRRKIMDYRSGQLKPDDKIKKIFKL